MKGWIARSIRCLFSELTCDVETAAPHIIEIAAALEPNLLQEN